MIVDFNPTGWGDVKELAKIDHQPELAKISHWPELRCSSDSMLQIEHSHLTDACHYKPITPSSHAYGLNRDQQSKLLLLN